MSGSAVAADVTDYQIDVWADNWFAAYLDGQLLLEDSVSITTERSFNAESFQFSAGQSFQLAFVIKDFKQNDTGLEYIGSRRQQMGDGGFVTQVTDRKTDRVVAVSGGAMRCLVVHKAPLDTACVGEESPVAGRAPCGFTVTEAPVGWKAPDFDDSRWQPATQYAESAIRPKDGYYKIAWHSDAKLIWSDDLEKDNTLLCRLKVNPE
jgi:hypothetical protein